MNIKGICFIGRFLLALALFLNSSLIASVPEDLVALISTRFGMHPTKIEPLGGIVNENYAIHAGESNHYVLKIFNPKIGGYILRNSEVKNQTMASIIKIAPKIDLINDHAALIEWVSGQEIQVDQTNIANCAELMGKLHYSNLHFKETFSFPGLIAEQIEVCKKEQKINFDEEGVLKTAIKKFDEIFFNLDIPSNVACHNDLHPSNILVSPEGLRFIDWEDSSMNDPAWDVCFFLISNFVPEDLWGNFFKTYHSYMKVEDPIFMERVKAYRPFVLLKIAINLKTYLTKEQQQGDEFCSLINLCMQSAEQIFVNQDYQKGIADLIKNRR